MTTHVVADDMLGQVSRRRWEVERRLMEGTLDPGFVAKNLQLIAESKSVSTATAPIAASPFFANEEVKSNYGYPQGYAVKPIAEQVIALAKHFPGLDAGPVLALAKDLPECPPDAEGPYVFPRWQKVANTYNDGVEKILEIIGATRPFCNYRKGALGSKYLKQSDRTLAAEQLIWEKQKSDYMLVWAQLGLRHRGRSVRRVRIVYAPNEFGLGAFSVGSILLAHPGRLVQWSQLHMDCPGDEYSPDAGGQFGHAPYLSFDDVGVRFDASGVSDALGDFGAASGFFPQ